MPSKQLIFTKQRLDFSLLLMLVLKLASETELLMFCSKEKSDWF
jgi:hypothetical protein